MQVLKSYLRHILPLTVVITLLTALVYIVAQQNYRISANDPQIQMAEDIAVELSSGQSFDTAVSAANVDIGKSLAPYVVVFDSNGRAVAGSGMLHNQLPVLPPGIFEYTSRMGEDRVTWQPEPGVRSAAVIVHYTGTRSGFVMAGRSLREVEARIDQLTLLTGAGWVGTLAVTVVVTFLVELLFRDNR